MGQEAENVDAPTANWIDAAVTDEPSGAPMTYVPAVDADHRPTYVAAAVPAFGTVMTALFDVDPADAAAVTHA